MFSYSYRNEKRIRNLGGREIEVLRASVSAHYFEFSQTSTSVYNVWAWTQEKIISISFIK